MPSESRSRGGGLPPPRASVPTSFKHTDYTRVGGTCTYESTVNALGNRLSTCLARSSQTAQIPAKSDETCPGCLMPYDRNRKRRLTEACGHERCYSCIFQSQICPLCAPGQPLRKAVAISGSKTSLLGSSQQLYATPSSAHARNKVKTNGHFSAYIQNRSTTEGLVTGLPPERASPALPPRPLGGLNATAVRAHAGQTPRRPLLGSPAPSPRLGRSPFSQLMAGPSIRSRSRSQSRPSPSPSPTRVGGPASTALPQACWENQGNDSHTPRWPTRAVRKIKSLWAIDEDKKSDLYQTVGGVHSHKQSQESFGSCSSNTSPMSTLTGSSASGGPLMGSRARNPSSDRDSLGSSLSMTSPTPLTSSRRHSLTTSHPGPVEEAFGKRQSIQRRSARTGPLAGPVDPKIRFAQYRSPQFALKPLFFQVPQQEPDPLFIARGWLFKELSALLLQDSPGPGPRGVVLSGNTGSGKTAAVLQLVERSCFGRPREGGACGDNNSRVLEGVASLASHLVAYHFCQADNASTCLLPDFVHSLAAQLVQAPQLSAYRHALLQDPALQAVLSMKECVADPHTAFRKGILEPLSAIRRVGTTCLIVIDGLCEAEYHRPDAGDTLASFLARHALQTPPWLKFFVTVRTQFQDISSLLPFARISLDGEPSHQDLVEYVTFRVNNSPAIRYNISLASKMPGTSSPQDSIALQGHRLAQHLALLSKGSFLHTKTSLDLVEKGHLVLKSASFKVFPVSLAEVFLLHFNLRFPSLRAFERVQPLLCVALAALTPLTLLEMYHSVNALMAHTPLTWEEFLSRVQILQGLLVSRSDDTYMLFHPSFREWLVRREEGDSPKFLCDPRLGHAGLALRLSRLEAPLDGDKTLELGHHLLKAHLYKSSLGNGRCATLLPPRDLQAVWVALASDDVSAALAAPRNVYSPNVKVSRLLLLAGSSPDHSLGRWPLLCLAAQQGLVDMVALLLEFGAFVDAVNPAGISALMLAAQRGHSDVVRLAVQAGAKLGLKDAEGQCALVHAALSGHLNVVAYLASCDWPTLEEEAEPSDLGDMSLAEAAQQALVAAALQGHTQVVEFLLDMCEVRVNLVDSARGETALTAAAAVGHAHTCRALLRRGANPTVTNLQDTPALLCAVAEGQWEVAEALLEGGANLEQADASGRTALMLAAGEGHVGVVELLLSKGCSVTKVDKEGLTALSWACLKGQRHAASTLLDRGADPNHTDKLGRTPLDLAAIKSDQHFITVLLEKGAVLEHVDHSGLRPLDRAIDCRNLQAVQALLRRGAKLGPATWALAAGKPDILLILLGKLLDDGNTLYKKHRLQESAYRYSYALKKFPSNEEINGGSRADQRDAFQQLKLHLLLNLARCKRKMGEFEESVQVCGQVLQLKPDSYEAFYARARAKKDMGQLQGALEDLKAALLHAPPSKEVRRLLNQAKEELEGTLPLPLPVSAASTSATPLTTLYSMGALGTSLDTLSDHDMSSGLGSSLASERVH